MVVNHLTGRDDFFLLEERGVQFRKQGRAVAGLSGLEGTCGSPNVGFRRSRWGGERVREGESSASLVHHPRERVIVNSGDGGRIVRTGQPSARFLQEHHGTDVEMTQRAGHRDHVEFLGVWWTVDGVIIRMFDQVSVVHTQQQHAMSTLLGLVITWIMEIFSCSGTNMELVRIDGATGDPGKSNGCLETVDALAISDELVTDSRARIVGRHGFGVDNGAEN